MGQQSARQTARRAALDAQAQRRRERAERDRRIEALAVDVLTALEERKVAIADCERRAGLALQKLTEDEGLSVKQAIEWCADSLSAAEIRRLIAIEMASPQRSTGHDAISTQMRANQSEANTSTTNEDAS